MAWGRWRQVRELPRGRRMEDDGAGLRGENRKSNQGGAGLLGLGAKLKKKPGERFWGRKQRKRWLCCWQWEAVGKDEDDREWSGQK